MRAKMVPIIVTLAGVVVAAFIAAWLIDRPLKGLEQHTGPTGAPAGSELDRFLQLQHLTVDDLEANRRGEVTPRQADRLTRYSQRQWMMPHVLAGVLLLGAIIAATILYTQHSKPLIFLLIPGALLVAGLAYLGAYLNFGRPVAELEEGKLTAVKGPIEDLQVDHSRAVGFSARIQGETYTAMGAIEIGKHLTDGRTVTAYVLPRTRRIVAVEPE